MTAADRIPLFASLALLALALGNHAWHKWRNHGR